MNTCPERIRRIALVSLLAVACSVGSSYWSDGLRPTVFDPTNASVWVWVSVAFLARWLAEDACFLAAIALRVGPSTTVAVASLAAVILSAVSSLVTYCGNKLATSGNGYPMLGVGVVGALYTVSVLRSALKIGVLVHVTKRELRRRSLGEMGALALSVAGLFSVAIARARLGAVGPIEDVLGLVFLAVGTVELWFFVLNRRDDW